MSKCEHTFWLELAAGKAVPQLVYGSRLARLVNELPKPSAQLPQLIFFMGRRQKNQALRQLCSSNYRGQSRHQGSINIRSDNRTLHSLQPRFFADCDPTCRSLLAAFGNLRVCHPEQVFPVELPTEHSLLDLMLSRLLFLFVDVLCIFADDVGGLEGVRELLATWARIGSASSLPRAVRPRVIVVVGNTPSITHSLLDEGDFLLELLNVADLPFFAAFGDIKISRLLPEELSPDARYLPLGGDITQELRNMRFSRECHSALFTARHFQAFFEVALKQISTAPLSQFDFIRAARQQNPLDGAFSSHLINFLKIGNKTRAPYDEMASYIASAILMDAYPPGMPGFPPLMVFQALYRDARGNFGPGQGLTGHVFEIFGEVAPHADCEYIVRQCILCEGSRCLTVRLKPPTAAPRVLSIDGGGSRVIVPLENLEMLQEAVGPDMPIADLFDLMVGCSSGGLLALSLDILRLGVSECKSLFRALIKQVFESSWRRFINLFLSDEAYNTRVLEDILKDHFEPGRRLFDVPASLLSSGKVAVIATSIKDGAPFIFTNYNGAAPHRAEPVYGRLRPDVEYEPFVWQVARATSAAPLYFSAVDIPGLGTFQDGGMGRHNNPLNIALSEAKHLWPNVADPDVVVTLGTGSETASPKASRFRNALVDGWIPRVYRSWKTSFNGHVTWKEVEMRLGKEDGYFRFDEFLPYGLPAMDSTDCMDLLSDQTRMQCGEDHEEAALALLTACLYFQLNGPPDYQTGLYHCTGARDFYKENLNLGLQLSSDDICQVCHRYSLPVRFFVRDLNENITLSLRLGATIRRLSAFPNSIQWYIDEQKLDCPFGSPNHGIPLRMDCPGCDSRVTSRGQKRKYIDI
ncbi:hypothetical protein EYZ11_006944 [Aspergillus tanneri]|uniref:PNPLA domain-containing protein n=1 Tax=Aspergillus tanneri TaxID=1220188 RepID=A0A4S3JJW8_9EURO|nr:hypothetical protein EYZ11_006944 [Aspergillus tanneri]